MGTLPIVGNVARDDDFFGRRDEMAEVWRTLQTDHLLLLAPRRVGKTSIIERLERDAPDHGFSAIRDSVEGCTDELDFVTQLYRAAVRVDGRFLERVANHPAVAQIKRLFPKNVRMGPVDLRFEAQAERHWKELGEALVSTLSSDEARYIVLVDELPLFVLKLAEYDEGRPAGFLEWFRSVRQRLPAVRWLVAGSIGLDGIAETMRLSATINDMVPFHLGAYSTDEAHAYVVWATTRAEFDLAPAVRQYLIAKTGWPIPFFLALFIRELDRVRSKGQPLDTDAVDAAFEGLLGITNRARFSHWNERLDEQLRDDAGRARRLLELICSRADGVKQRALLDLEPDDESARASRRVLNVLYAEGYILRDDEDRWRFRSPLLREYWSRHVSVR